MPHWATARAGVAAVQPEAMSRRNGAGMGPETGGGPRWFLSRAAIGRRQHGDRLARGGAQHALGFNARRHGTARSSEKKETKVMFAGGARDVVRRATVGSVPHQAPCA